MTISAKEYHSQTSYDRYHMTGHNLDWKNQPSVYKDYPDAEIIRLPGEASGIDEMLSRICTKPKTTAEVVSLSIETISRIFLNCYRITGKTHYNGQDFFYRSVASAGALYPFELYLAVKSIEHLEDGLYHYDIRRHELRILRKGNFFKEFAGSGVTFFITAILFRSSWKYRDRSYRYHLLDTGHLAENVALTLSAVSIPFEVTYDFDDAAINSFIGLSEHREVCLAMIQIPGHQGISEEKIHQAEPLPETFKLASRVAGREVNYPLVDQFHKAASSIHSPNESDEMMLHTGLTPSSWFEIPQQNCLPEIMNYSEAMTRRRSLRNFVKTELSKNHFDALMNMMCCRNKLYDDKTLCTAFLADHVEGLSSGCYLLNTAKCTFGLIQTGHFMDLMAHICSGQEWLTNAALHVCFIVNLEYLENLWAARGYRYALISAGQIGQRLYLGATSLGLGCCGIGAFYDTEVSKLLELNDASAMVYLIAIGQVKRLK